MATADVVLLVIDSSNRWQRRTGCWPLDGRPVVVMNKRICPRWWTREVAQLTSADTVWAGKGREDPVEAPRGCLRCRLAGRRGGGA